MLEVKDNIKSEKVLKDKVKENNKIVNIKPVKNISILNDYNECKLINGLVNYII